MRRFFTVAALSIAVAAPAAAQMSVTTFGATNAQGCYEDASGLTSDPARCDAALKEALSARDERATRVNRGIVLNRAGRYAEALEDFDAAIAEDGSLAEAYLNRGNTHLLAGRPDAALADYEQALALGLGKAHIAWYNIGLVHEAKNDREKAREAYAKALELSPDFTEAQRKLAETAE